MYFVTRRRPGHIQKVVDERHAKLTERAAREREESLRAYFDNERRQLRKNARQAKTWQWSAIAAGVIMTIWVGLVTGIFIDFAVTYIFTNVDQDRERYTLDAAMALAHAKVGRAFADVLRTRDAVCFAVHNGLIRGFSARAAFEATLAPALLQSPFVRGVELTASGQPHVLSVSSKNGALMMQSNAADCFLLGPEGCSSSVLHSGERPSWWNASANLAMSSIGKKSGDDGFTVRSGWAAAPELMITHLADDGSAGAIALLYKLTFRCGDDLQIAGRVALDIGALSGLAAEGTELNDERLGEAGRVYVINAAGMVVASQLPEDVLLVESGQVRFAWLWELPGLEWTRGTVAGPGGLPERYLHRDAGRFACIQRLPRPFEQFATLIVVPSRGPFLNTVMLAVTVASIAVALVPWCCCCGFSTPAIYRQWHKALSLRRPPEHVTAEATVQELKHSETTTQIVEWQGPPQGRQ